VRRKFFAALKSSGIKTESHWKSVGRCERCSCARCVPRNCDPGSIGCFVPPNQAHRLARPAQIVMAIVTNASFHCTSFDDFEGAKIRRRELPKKLHAINDAVVNRVQTFSRSAPPDFGPLKIDLKECNEGRVCHDRINDLRGRARRLCLIGRHKASNAARSQFLGTQRRNCIARQRPTDFQ